MSGTTRTLTRSVKPGLVALALAVTIATPGMAQYLGGGTKTLAEAQVGDLEQMKGKFLGLADAFPETTYDWRPMEGVRSVKDVLALIAAEGPLFPTQWGFPAPDWVAGGGFRPEMDRLGALNKAELATEITRSFDHIVSLVKGLSDEQRTNKVNFFGLTVDLGTAVSLMANDMHEHLGQLIAYARMNQIVPPWSRRPAQ